MIALQWHIWMALITPIWESRNNILHNMKNRVTIASDQHLVSEGLEWYSSNRHKVLNVHDHRLAEFNIQDMRSWTHRIKREWLCHLDIAKDAHTREYRIQCYGHDTATHHIIFQTPSLATPDHTGGATELSAAPLTPELTLTPPSRQNPGGAIRDIPWSAILVKYGMSPLKSV